MMGCACFLVDALMQGGNRAGGAQGAPGEIMHCISMREERMGARIFVNKQWRVVRVASVIALCLVFVGIASARHWPSPPGWWLNSQFAQCVRQHESGNGTTTRNIYGMQAGWAVAGGSGWAGDATRAEQNYRAYLLFKRYGDGAWRPYDGCVWNGQ